MTTSRTRSSQSAPDRFRKRIEAARQAYVDKMIAEARKAREAFVVPVCHKYGLNFRSGNGTWFFSGHDGDSKFYVEDEEEARRHGLPDLVPVVRLLNQDVHSFSQGTKSDPMSRLGTHVADVVTNGAKSNGARSAKRPSSVRRVPRRR